MPTAKKSPKKMSRSARLKRYESVYTKAVKRGGTGSATKPKVRKAPRKSPRRRTKPQMRRTKTRPEHKLHSTPKTKNQTKKVNQSSKIRRKKLTVYQKFVKTESKKSKYKAMSPKDRMKAIGARWNVLKEKNYSIK